MAPTPFALCRCMTLPAQSRFEETAKSILSAAHRDYISRIERGDDPETVMSELLDSSLSEIQEAVER